MLNEPAPPQAAAPRYFEDYLPGAVLEFGSTRVDEAELLEFARKYDPQPFHVDAARAAASPFGGLIASGWHTGSMMMRMLAEHYLAPETSLGSPGLEQLRWPAPVRPGDTLSLRVTVLEARRSSSKPDRGLVRSLIEVVNQRREVVMSVNAVNFVLCKTAAAAEGVSGRGT